MRFCEAADDAASHKEGSELDGGESRAELAEVARLWQLNRHTLSRGLTERGMTTRRGSNYAIPLNPATAADWRQKVLSKGGSLDERSLIRAFLGRAPSEKAYADFLKGD